MWLKKDKQLMNNYFRRFFISRIEFKTTSKVAPTSAIIAIHSVNRPGITKRSAIIFNPSEKAIFCLIIFNARLLRDIV